MNTDQLAAEAAKIIVARRKDKITDPAILAKVAGLVVGDPSAHRRAS